MAVFFVLFLVPIILHHIGIKGIDYEKKNRFALGLFFVLLTVLIMLRHESVGNDTRSYIYMFHQFSLLDWADLSKLDIEIGFSYFTKFISLFSSSPQVFLTIAAITVSVMIYPTYKRLCVDTSLTIALFSIMSIFVMMFSGIRQMLAIGIGIIAYECTRRKKLIPFIILVLLAITVHTSAFMLIFMYPLYHARITKKWLYVVVPVLIVIFVFNKQFFAILGAFLLRYTAYDVAMEQTGAYMMMILFALFAVFAFLIPDESAIDDETIGLRNFLLLSLVIQMFAPLNTLAMRMGYYYIIFIPLLLPKIIEYRSERWHQVAIVGRHVMVVFFLLYFFYRAYTGDSNLHVFPYKFFWETAI